ncbi:peptidoglycan DD-metalloendopeptidase family protein [Falsihalocynthiibacter sp. S25ZX9]|uniref:peptidoglycan DD-metalloendopeptidase family protein n=1 Tax=Falsihalocynthiibacter sp. S25ZX9 TaxID=3240870 RepID=UPI00351035AC
MQKLPTHPYSVPFFHNARTASRTLLVTSALFAVTACSDGFDTDLRGNFGNSFTTTSQSTRPTEPAPKPDARGVVSYPSYQVVLARKGETVADIARRLGLNENELAKYNGVSPSTQMRSGELLALPQRVAEPATSSTITSGAIDITTLAGDAIDRAGTPIKPASTPAQPASAKVAEPVRHKVERGETAYSVARLYNVSVRSLTEWNGLGSDLAVREGQYLLIPLPDAEAEEIVTVSAVETQPGQGSVTPLPPSAAVALPAETPLAAAAVVPTPASPDMGAQQTAASEKATRLQMPVSGKIIREYQKGKNDGIDISAAVGTPIKAAEAGKVAAVTVDTEGVTIVVIRHADGLLTVYANVDGVTVQKGETVTRGQNIAKMRAGNPAFLHFEVRQGFDSVDPTPFVS